MRTPFLALFGKWSFSQALSSSLFHNFFITNLAICTSHPCVSTITAVDAPRHSVFTGLVLELSGKTYLHHHSFVSGKVADV